MLDAALIVGGCLVVLAVFVDALATTLSVGTGAGPITRPLLDAVWRRLLRVPREFRRRWILPHAGPSLVVATELLWVGSLWAGWSLVFLGSDAIVSSEGDRPATPLEVVYFTGSSLVTLGMGDFVPEATPWPLVSVVAGLSGLFLITLAITYLLSVVDTIVERRSIATTVNGLGPTATGAVVNGWDGTTVAQPMLNHLVRLSETVSANAEKHLAYPVVQYFHASGREVSAPSSLAQLDDVVSLLWHGIQAGSRPPLSALRPVRQGLDRYLAVMSLASTQRPQEPPVPSLAPLRDAGIPVVPDQEFRAAMRERVQHRRDLHALVRNDDWTWPPSA